MKALLCNQWKFYVPGITNTLSRDGVVVIALASHLPGLGLGHKWVKLVACSILCSERFFSGFSGFPRT